MSIGIVLSLKNSDWKSCTRIVSNLLKSYTLFLKEQDYKIYNLSRESNTRDILKLSKEIQKDEVQHLIFLDHRPHPLGLIKILCAQKHQVSKITFHLYGDFILDLGEWYEAAQLTKKMETKFVAASLKQQRLVQGIFAEGSQNIYLCPFPVDKKEFSFDPEIRKEERQKLNIKEDEFVFVYTGRLSRGKQLIPLIKAFESFKKISGQKRSRLLLVGMFDNIVNPIVNAYSAKDYYRYRFQEIYFSFSQEVRESITYLGPREADDLFKLYNLSDCFISLSLYHDEDYGMSPIESLFCGTDAILTDWGGFHSFAVEEESCSLVKTSFKKREGASFEFGHSVKKMMKALLKQKSYEEREKTSAIYHESFSIEACAKKYESLMKNKGANFTGFSKLGKEILASKNPFSKERGVLSKLYFDTYKDYVSE